MKSVKTSLPLAFLLLATPAFCATVTITPGTYTENFDSMVSFNNEPVPGWLLRTDATASSLGVGAAQQIPTTLRAWTHTNGQFKNVSSTNIPQSSTQAEQNANPNRALGLNQTSGYADPGASFNFNFSTSTAIVETISIDLLLLNNVARSTPLTIQYGIGASPTSFVTLATWSDADLPGGWGSTPFTFDRSDFGSELDEQPQAWFRVVALTPSTGDEVSPRDQMGIDNFSITASAVPEPSTMILGALGLLGLVRRRR